MKDEILIIQFSSGFSYFMSFTYSIALNTLSPARLVCDHIPGWDTKYSPTRL
jgi:hypothetical protein